MDAEAVRTAYRRWAGIYDRMFGKVFEAGRSAAVERINRQGGQRVLEVGVGTGLSLPQYRRDNRIVGIDLSTDMLKIARQRQADLNLANVDALLEMDAGQLAFADDSFDVVVAMYVMTVVPDPPAALAELERVCRPGGQILIINHFEALEPGPRRMVERALGRFSRDLGWRPDYPMETLMAGSGLELVGIDPVPPFGLFSFVECRKAVAVPLRVGAAE